MKAIKIFGKFARCRGKLAIFKSNQRTSPQVSRGENEFPFDCYTFCLLSRTALFTCFLCLVDSDTAVENLFILGIHLNRSFE